MYIYSYFLLVPASENSITVNNNNNNNNNNNIHENYLAHTIIILKILNKRYIKILLIVSQTYPTLQSHTTNIS